VAEGDRLQHLVLGHFLGTRLDHQHGFSVPATTSSICEASCSASWIGDELAIDEADADRADRAAERNARDRQRGGGAVHGQDVGIVLRITGDHQADDLDLVAEALGKSGRIGRSIRRQVRISFLTGAPSRLK
jgi:hypothetical protein